MALDPCVERQALDKPIQKKAYYKEHLTSRRVAVRAGAGDTCSRGAIRVEVTVERIAHL